MTGAATVSVVLATYTVERLPCLRVAVESVREQAVQPLEILVVVDHDSLLLERAHSELDGTTVLHSPNPRGLSGARNAGIAAARGSVVAFLDDDACAEPSWLGWLTDPFTDPAVLAVGGAVQPWWVDGRPSWYPEEFAWVVGCSYRGMPSGATPVRNVIGANMAFRQDVFGEIGGFRDGLGRVEQRPFGCEETELCIRIRQRWPAGLVLYEPRAVVRHRVPSTRTAWRYFRMRCFAEGRSKAAVASIVGSAPALSNERRHALRVLPAGVGRGVADALRGDLSGAARAAAIVAGLAITTSGYAVGAGRAALSSTTRRRPAPWP